MGVGSFYHRDQQTRGPLLHGRNKISKRLWISIAQPLGG
jgi:hypothetical protein